MKWGPEPPGLPDGHEWVEYDAEAGVAVSTDPAGKRHITMRADPGDFDLTDREGLTIKCGRCEASVVLTDPPSEDAKGWSRHPALGWRCRAHPYAEAS